MKFKFLILILLLSIKVSGCKCAHDPDLKESFKNADFVFIGEIYSIQNVPSGYKTLQSIVSSVKIQKIFKSGDNDGYYKDQATLFTSAMRSCDYPFTENGKFLIFAYFDTDTGFLYSEYCLATKKLDQVSKEDLNLLDTLSKKFNYKLKTENSKLPEASDILIEDLFNKPNREINKLKITINSLEEENKNLKILIGAISIILIFVVLILILKRKRNIFPE